jgi:putative DNA primase/helicase
MSTLDDRLRELAQETVANKTRRALSVVRMSDVEPEEVAWLWRSRIARGKINLLVGDPGTGKSFASLAIAASVTNGRALPDDEPREPANVVIWNGEDGVADTIRPRAEATGVQLDRLFAIQGEQGEDGRVIPFGLSSLRLLEDYVGEAGGVSLVIIDPVAALLTSVDSHRDSDIRSALQPLADFAERSRVAVLAIAHLNKRDAERALYRVGGSIGFVGLARSVMLAAVDPESGRRAIAPIKSNLAAFPPPIEYSIDGEGRFWWGHASEELSAEQLLRPARGKRPRVQDAAESFLREVLADGPQPTVEVERIAGERGLSEIAIVRARKSISVVSTRSKNGWMLSLAES